VQPQVRAEALPQAQVPAFADEVQVGLAQRREERVGVATPLGAALRRHLELVGAERRLLEAALEEAGEALAGHEREHPVALVHHHRRGVGPPGAEEDAAVGRVRTEQGVGSSVSLGQELPEGLIVHRGRGVYQNACAAAPETTAGPPVARAPRARDPRGVSTRQCFTSCPRISPSPASVVCTLT
jgi:hypothetical protein